MGCQGEMYVIYGVQVDAKVEWKAGSDKNPVVYSVNGHTLCDDEDLTGLIKEDPDEAPKGCPEIEFYNGVPTCYYGASDMPKTELVMRVLGHSGEYGNGDMGSRHFDNKVLVGYVAGCESYWNSASEISKVEDIHAQAPRLIDEIKKKLGLDIEDHQLGLHLLFDSLNGY